MNPLLFPLEPLYRRAMTARRAQNLARRLTTIAPCPILSIGNLSVGGTGKTPTTQWAARMLQRQGWRVAVVGRGYGGSSSARGALVSDGRNRLISVDEAGDEAVLHARNLPNVIVSIGANRLQAVQIAVDAGAEVAVLDDGFQFWSLPRAFDLVLLDARRPFDNGHLLPAGRLREEPATLGRADTVLLTRVDRPTMEELNRTHRAIRRYTQQPTFEAWHAPLELVDERSGATLPLKTLKNRNLRAFAGLASNAQFYGMLRELGARFVDTPQRERGDHHNWKKRDLVWTTSSAIRGAPWPTVTTEKDATKVDPNWFEGELWSLRVALGFRDGEAELERLICDKLSAW